MEEANLKDSMSILRSKIQTDIQSQREKRKEVTLASSRVDAIETQIGDEVNPNEVKALVLELNKKKKKFDVIVLRRIKHACCKSDFIDTFFKINGAFDALIPCLRSHDAQIQLETVACFTNLACGPHKLCFRVVKVVGAYLVSFINSSSHYLQTQSSWAVRNIANDCIHCYSKLKAQGVFPALLKALESPMSDVTESVVYALSSCLKYGDLDLVIINESIYGNYLLKLIEERNLPQNTVREAAYTLANGLYIAVGTSYDCSSFNLMKLLNCLKELIDENNDYLAALLLIRCLGYLSTYDWVVQSLYSSTLFSEIVERVICHSSQFLRKELFWVLTNISVFQVIGTEHSLFLPILKALDVFLNPLEPAISAVLYYVCCTATQSETIHSLYRQHNIIAKIENLTNCGNVSLEKSSKMCLIIMKDYSS